MHELGITRNIVAIVSERAHGAKIQRITLEVGKLSAVLPDALQFCFDVVSKGTVVEGATLEILEIAGRGHCQTCDRQFPLEQLYEPCPCGSTHITRIHGEELNIKHMVTA